MNIKRDLFDDDPWEWADFKGYRMISQDRRRKMLERLVDLSKFEYNALKGSGMFWEFYPGATGIYEQDLQSARERLKKLNSEQEM